MNFDTDLSTEASLCRVHYDRVRELVLEDREWRFATRRFKPAKLTFVPEYGYEFAFQVPPNILRVLTMSANKGVRQGNTALDNNIEWEREEDMLFTNRDNVFARGTLNLETTTKFSPGFVEAFATRLEAELSVPLTGSDKKKDRLLKEYDKKLASGSTRDGMQGKARKRRAGRLQSARYRGGGGFDVLTDN